MELFAHYSTIGSIRLLALTLLLLYVPGYFVARLFAVQRALAFGAAPLVSIAILILFGSLLDLPKLQLTTIALVIYASIISRSHFPSSSKKITTLNHAFYAFCTFFTFGLFRWPVWAPWTNSIPQSTDSVWHGYLIATIRDFGLNGPENTVRVDGILGGSLSYPYGIHTIPGLLAGKGALGVAGAMNSFHWSVAMIVMPISLFFLVKYLTDKTSLGLISGLLGLSAPNLIESSFHLYAFGLTTMLLPSFLILLAPRLIEDKDIHPSLIGLSLFGLFVCHSSLGFFGALILLIIGIKFLFSPIRTSMRTPPHLLTIGAPLLLAILAPSLLFRIFSILVLGVGLLSSAEPLSELKLLNFSISVGKRILNLTTAVIVFLLISTPWIFAQNRLPFEQYNGDVVSSRFQQLLSVRKPRFETFSEFFEGFLTGTSILQDRYSNPSIVSLLAILIAIIIFRRKVLVACALAVLLYSSAATGVLDAPGRSIVGGIWLGDPYRIAAVFEILLIPLGLTIISTGWLQVRSKRANEFRRVIPHVVIASIVVSVIVTESTHSFNSYFRGWVNNSEARTVDLDQLNGLRTAGELTPPGGRVLNFFGDGSPWIFAETGTAVVSVWGDASVSPDDMWPAFGILEQAVQNVDSPQILSIERSIRQALERLSICTIYVGSGNVNASESPFLVAMRSPKTSRYFDEAASSSNNQWKVLVPKEHLLPGQCLLGAGVGY